MFPEIAVHRPRGVVPKVAVRKRTVLECQPGWLLLAVPAVLALRAAGRKTREQAQAKGQAESAQPAPAPAAADMPDPVPAPRSRRRHRPAQLVAVPLSRLRRKPGRTVDNTEFVAAPGAPRVAETPSTGTPDIAQAGRTGP